MRIWKEVLLPGRQRDARGNWFSFSRRDVHAARKNIAKMLSRRVPVPCVWEHLNVEAGDPEEWRARYAKHTFAHVAGHRINSRGGLELLHDVPDPKDVDQLLKTRFVSPKVYPQGYSDSRGGEYRGATIAHVAATPTPVQFWQRPFQLSRTDALFLSYQPEGRTVAEETKKPAGDAGADGDFKALLDALRETGMTIPDEVTDVKGLIIAVKASGGAGAAEPDLDLDDEDAETETPAEPDVNADTAAAGGGGMPLMMSATQAAPLIAPTRRDLINRAEKLFRSGRITKPVAEDLVRRAKAVDLSFTRAGELANVKVADEIAAYERLPKHMAWKPKAGAADPVELSSTREVAPPKHLTGSNDPKAASEWLCANLPPAKK
jgi:hypothetical protein